MNIAIAFFSATGNTRAMARIIRNNFKALSAKVDLHDVTVPAARQKGVDLSAYDAAVFGSPVHSLRAPQLMRDWLATLDGNGMRCAMFFTFGGFMAHPAHHSTAEILKRRGFTVVASAEFPGKHTYNLGGWRAFPDRPDDRERDLAARYAEAAYNRFAGNDPGELSDLPQGPFSEAELTHFESFRFKMVSKLPTRDGTECSLCGLCEEICPSGAMNHATGIADPHACIACLGCVAACPENALVINSTRESWQPKLSMSNTTEAELNAQTGKIYL
ncbi:EFR1 family ferrodoxin [Oceanidesulfovibrio marinus]|uniref:4Fe-4S ferredoxin n=1 Tax=Oceanidesulfovibrio marinus TaxID=370038 RepID=A0ABX6NFB0_9BACT|nr:EFR1 family ferrodoxin [Oceanidesulfovibrio marinus]QJT09289.1 4Fe-4S ferredoxin [Oceanidesulfovibrio marinus]